MFAKTNKRFSQEVTSEVKERSWCVRKEEGASREITESWQSEGDWQIKLSCKEDIFCEKQGKEMQRAQKVDSLKIV